MKEELKRYLTIIERLRTNQDKVSAEDFKFLAEFQPDPSDKKKLSELNSQISELRKTDKTVSPELTAESALLAGQQAMQNPAHREQIMQLAEEADASSKTSKLSQGLGILLGVGDIASSAQQINQSKQTLNKSRRPGRPAIPQRDQYLQNALRTAQQGTFDAPTALAPVQAQIQDQYQADIQNAKTASTGQAGAFGAYAQVAANRRNRSSMELAPIANDIHRQEQANYNSLLGMRQQETQNQFSNQASLYPYDLNQYQNEQQAAGEIGSQGRQNLNNSLYNLAERVAPAVGQYSARNKYKKWYDQIDNVSPGMSQKISPSINYLEGRINPSQQAIEEMYIGY